MIHPRTALMKLVTLLALVFVFAAHAATALALPSEPTMNLETLETKLAAAPSGHLSGFLKTVYRGSTIETVAVDVLAVTGSGTNGSALILFEASGARITQFGGIVSGMSGSPIYVRDGAQDRLVGALAYGDSMTIGGVGLATPIEFMSEMQGSYGVTRLELAAPVVTRSGVVKNVTISTDAAAALDAPSQTLTVRPLASVCIGGIHPSSPAYKALEAALGEKGVSVTPLQSALSGGTAMSGGVPFSTELTAGASFAVLASRGDMWLGGIGTVTYRDDTTVVGLGHYAFGAGPTRLYMGNAWIDGVWPSTYMPYKVGRPGAMRGAIVQDRPAGVMGGTGLSVSETTITARATKVGSSLISTSTVYMPRAIVNSPDWGATIVFPAATVAAMRHWETRNDAGSAITTTTIVVNDGVADHTIRMHNVVDSDAYISYFSAYAVRTALSALSAVQADGLETLDVKSVDVQTRLSDTRNSARIVDVQAPAGIKTGANRVTVSLLKYGVAATQTVETTLVVPAGMPLQGTLSATLANTGMFDDEDEYSGSTRKSIAQIVDEINALDAENVLSVSYSVMADEEMVSASATPSTVSTEAVTSSALWGRASRSIGGVTLSVRPSVVPYGGYGMLVGTVEGPTDVGLVSVYGTSQGSTTETLIATTTAEVLDGEAMFFMMLPRLNKHTTLRVVCESDGSNWANLTASKKVYVGARVMLRPSTTNLRAGNRVALAAVVYPKSAAGRTVSFQYYSKSARTWKTITTKSLTTTSGVSNASATYRWAPRRGTYRVRVRFNGSTYNAPTNSSATTIRVW